jgi:hypothetical protein
VTGLSSRLLSPPATVSPGRPHRSDVSPMSSKARNVFVNSVDLADSA